MGARDTEVVEEFKGREINPQSFPNLSRWLKYV
jgi:hypothetical protein